MSTGMLGGVSLRIGHCQLCGEALYPNTQLGLGHQCPPLDRRLLLAIREILKERDAIRLKYIKEMLGQLNQDATGIHILKAEEAAIKEFLGEPV